MSCMSILDLQAQASLCGEMHCQHEQKSDRPQHCNRGDDLIYVYFEPAAI